MVFRVVTWIITVIIGAVRALCPRCARAVPALCENAPLGGGGGMGIHLCTSKWEDISVDNTKFQHLFEIFPGKCLLRATRAGAPP